MPLKTVTAVTATLKNNFPLYVEWLTARLPIVREFGIRKGLKKLVISSKIRIFIGENQ